MYNITEELIQLEQKDLKGFREEIYRKNSGICPILKKVVPFEKTVVDHQHKLKSEVSGIDGKGLVRGVIDFRVNSLEGKITNLWKRLGLEKEIELPNLLRNLADYLNDNLQKEEIKYIHPAEKIQIPKISKSKYNALKKAYEKSGRKAKFPEFPKSGKITEKLQKLFGEFGIQAFN